MKQTRAANTAEVLARLEGRTDPNGIFLSPPRVVEEQFYFGLVEGCNFQKVINRLLKKHGLILHSRSCYRKWGDQEYLWIEKIGKGKIKKERNI